MIGHLGHSGIDKAMWDERLSRCANRMWYVQSWVLDITAPGWEALADDVSGAIMPLLWRRKFGIKYLFQPYGTQQQGVFAPEYDDALGERFLRSVPSTFRYWDIALNEWMGANISVPKVHFHPLRQQVLPLDRPVNELRSAYSTNHRRNLKKGPGIEIVQDVLPREFKTLFIRTTARRFNSGGSSDHDTMERVIHEALARGQCRILGQRENGAVIAAAVFMEWGGRGILYKSGMEEAASRYASMFHIVDRYIEMNAGTGLLLDFAGSSASSVARFNAGFGAQGRIYLRLRKNDLPFPLRWFKK